MLSTVVAAIIFLWLGFAMRKRATSGVPGKLQLIWEILVEQVSDLADSAIGPKGKRFVPLGVDGVLVHAGLQLDRLSPHGDAPRIVGRNSARADERREPAAGACRLRHHVGPHRVPARARVPGYFKHYTKPFAALTPINVIEEITKPITLTFRLFGNIFSGGLFVVVLLTLLPAYVTWPFEIVWKLFDTGLLGTIQAYIFMLLTIIYFGMAMSHEEARSDPDSQLETVSLVTPRRK